MQKMSVSIGKIMSLKAAIVAKCTECIYDSESPGTKLEQIHNCTSYACPLYPHRPQRKKHVKGAQPEWLKKYKNENL